MKKFNSIKKNSDFQKVYRTGRSFANKLLVMYVIKTEREDTRIGISVSKKVGNSVVRHHITRLVRESYRLNKDRVKTGLDIVVVARAAAKESDFKKIESAYLHLCGLHKDDTGISEIYFPAYRTSLQVHAYLLSIRH